MKAQSINLSRNKLTNQYNILKYSIYINIIHKKKVKNPSTKLVYKKIKKTGQKPIQSRTVIIYYIYIIMYDLIYIHILFNIY